MTERLPLPASDHAVTGSTSKLKLFPELFAVCQIQIQISYFYHFKVHDFHMKFSKPMYTYFPECYIQK